MMNHLATQSLAADHRRQMTAAAQQHRLARAARRNLAARLIIRSSTSRNGAGVEQAHAGPGNLKANDLVDLAAQRGDALVAQLSDDELMVH